MIIIGIDPGPTTSGYAVLEGPAQDAIIDMTYVRVVVAEDTAPTDRVIDAFAAVIKQIDPARVRVACEWLANYEKVVGASVFDTARVVGRYEQEARRCRIAFSLIKRPDVFLALCGRRTASKSQVRHAVIDAFPRSGGGATPQVGTKRQPGPLYGVRSHAWDAVAVAVAWTRGAGGER
jgi:Holliday junction resolvasome RuvABC endonuclease subunit